MTVPPPMRAPAALDVLRDADAWITAAEVAHRIGLHRVADARRVLRWLRSRGLVHSMRIDGRVVWTVKP